MCLCLCLGNMSASQLSYTLLEAPSPPASWFPLGLPARLLCMAQQFQEVVGCQGRCLTGAQVCGCNPCLCLCLRALYALCLVLCVLGHWLSWLSLVCRARMLSGRNVTRVHGWVMLKIALVLSSLLHSQQPGCFKESRRGTMP